MVLLTSRKYVLILSLILLLSFMVAIPAYAEMIIVPGSDVGGAAGPATSFHPITITTTDLPNLTTVVDVNVTVQIGKSSSLCLPRVAVPGNESNSALAMTLYAPNNTGVSLFSSGAFTTPGDFGIVTLTFDDAGASPVSGLPTSGTFAPTGQLSTFNGLNALGNWTVALSDNTSQRRCIYSYSIEITVADQPPLPSVTISATDNAGSEAGDPLTFTITRSAASPSALTVFYSASEIPTNGIDYSTLSGSVNIPANLTSVDVTVTPIEDSSVEGDEIITLTLTADATYLLGATTSDSGTISDDDTAGITIDPTGGLFTTEAGGTATFTVVLNAQPTADVVIALSSDNTAEGTLDFSSLTFTSANWNQAQTVTVMGIDDAVVDGNIAYLIVIDAASSSDPNYSGIDPSDVSVSNTDDDTAGITIDPTGGLFTTEAGGTATFTVVLNAQPTADVVIALSSDNTAEGTLDFSSLTFTSANWNQAQTVTVMGIDDAVVDGDVAYHVVTSVTSADPFYSALDPADVTATNTDDDTSGISASPLQFHAVEGNARSYQLALVTLPSHAPVVIHLTFDPSQLSVNGSSSPVDLSFTDQTPQTVIFQVVTNPDVNTDRDVSIKQQVISSNSSEYPVGMNAPTITIHIGDVPPPPPTPLCEDHNFDKGGVVRSGTSDALGYAINCRVLYQNGTPTQWLGNDLYNSGSIGIEGVLNLGVEQAIDIFSPEGMTYFQGGAVFCLRGEGTLIWMAASGMPRHAEVIGSYTVPDFPGFTCATLFEPGTFVLVSQNPLNR
ncbi:MAG: Calx-beta domain-containing protein [Chloroflexota bacterium]